MKITIEDTELSGSYEVSSEVGRAIFVLLSALESDQKFPELKKSVEVRHIVNDAPLNPSYYANPGQPIDWRDWTKGGR